MKRSPLKRYTKLKPLNPARQARRRKKYQAYLGSAKWKAIRLATFELDGWKCRECGWEDVTRTGRGLVADHSSYIRFGGEEIPGVDTRTFCTSCDRKQEAQRRPWNVGRRRSEG